jgi:hypothetical protein
MLYLRNWKLGYFNEMGTPFRIILNDIDHRPLSQERDPKELTQFMWKQRHGEWIAAICPDFFKDYTKPHLPNILAFSPNQDYYQAFSDTRTQEILTHYGVAYGVSYSEIPPSPEFHLLCRFLIRPSSPISDFVAKFRRKKDDDTMWIYKAEHQTKRPSPIN